MNLSVPRGRLKMADIYTYYNHCSSQWAQCDRNNQCSLVFIVSRRVRYHYSISLNMKQ